MNGQEEWRPVVGYEDAYEVSSWGRVRSITRTVTRSDGVSQVRKSRYLKISVMKSGHLRVGISDQATTRGRLIHRLVAEAFLGPPPEGKPLALHWDDNPANNQPSNLRWGTYADNRRDLMRNRPPRNANSEKKFCKRGHPFDEENTYYWLERRQCKKCRSVHELNRKRRRKGA